MTYARHKKAFIIYQKSHGQIDYIMHRIGATVRFRKYYLHVRRIFSNFAR